MKRFTIVTLLAACAGLAGCGTTASDGGGSSDAMATSTSGSSSGSMTSGSTGAPGANPTSGTTGGTDPRAGTVEGASAATTGERR